jgi:hypothetical protein
MNKPPGGYVCHLEYIIAQMYQPVTKHEFHITHYMYITIPHQTHLQIKQASILFARTYAGSENIWVVHTVSHPDSFTTDIRNQ